MAADAEAYARFLDDRRGVTGGVPVVMAQMQACAAHDTRARLAQLAMPTLVMHGTEDQMIPVENGRLIASLIAGAGLEIFDGVGPPVLLGGAGARGRALQARASLGV